jgi:hypothetical protein
VVNSVLGVLGILLLDLDWHQLLGAALLLVALAREIDRPEREP